MPLGLLEMGLELIPETLFLLGVMIHQHLRQTVFVDSRQVFKAVLAKNFRKLRRRKTFFIFACVVFNACQRLLLWK